MVHHWISLRNDKINNSCVNKRILRIFRNNEVRFYGDYEFDIYLGTKNDYDNLESVVKKVIYNGSGWINNNQLHKAKLCYVTDLSHYISHCCLIPVREFKKMFPRRENRNNYNIVKALELRNDGNFYMYACETSRFYYVICFATS